jgi:ribulose-phosphate 3-epimerase
VKDGATIESESSHRSQFALASPGVRMAPSLLAADFTRLEEEVARVEVAGAELLHLDVMDGHFVPNISFGTPVIASLRRRTRMFLDAHLMITDPMRYAEAFVKAGSDHITFHIEVADDPDAVVEHIHGLGVSAGVSLNPTTPVSAIEPILGKVDLVLVMSVWPGFGGQKFIRDVLPKVRELRARLAPHQRLQIDGGIDVATIVDAAAAGADTLVAGTAIFRQPDPPAAMAELRRRALEASTERGPGS